MITALVIAICVVASFLNASAAVLQRRAAGHTKANRLFRRNFIFRVLKKRGFLAGFGLQVLSGILSVIALWKGSLVLVEPILTGDMVFLMLILHFYLKVRMGPREWVGVAAVCAGLSVLLVAAEPTDNGFQAASNFWWVVVACATGAAIVIMAAIMRSSASSKARAGVGGVASGLNLALTASLLKLAFHQFNYGFSNVVSHWQFYVLLLSAASSIIVLQSTFAAGSLVVSQPAIEITTPVVSAAIGIFLLNETINHGAVSLIFEILGTLITAVGVILLGGSDRLESQSLKRQSSGQPAKAAAAKGV